MSSMNRRETPEESSMRAPGNSGVGRLLRIFPLIVVVCAIGAAAALIAWIPSIEGEVEDDFENSVPSQPAANPHSPYAHLQGQVVPRDMRTIHEGGPVGLLGLNHSPNDTPFCDESNWSRMEIVEQVDGQQVFVDQRAWKSAPVGTRAQLASWMSKCKRQGEDVEIYGDGSGALLATYHPSKGLVLLD
ncbi:MAG: hypothetical protein JRH19_19360 [Deltaproteobacteria bacterium]|nr:hypothetical protein [Deltaproteobacteria bacterium]